LPSQGYPAQGYHSQEALFSFIDEPKKKDLSFLLFHVPFHALSGLISGNKPFKAIA